MKDSKIAQSFVLPDDFIEPKKIHATDSLQPKSKSKQESQLEWGEAKPLIRDIPPPKPFPIEALGSLQNPVQDCNRIIQAPAAICAFSFIAAVNLAIQGHADIQISGRRNPISLFMVSIAASGDRKSAVDQEALAPHRDWQQQKYLAYEKDYASYGDLMDIYDSSKKQITADKKTNPEKKEALILSLEKPDEPLSPVLLVSEPTYEGVIRQLCFGYPTIGLFSDEGGRFLGGHAMSSDHRLKTAAGLSSLWDKGTGDRSRGGDGSSLFFGKRLAMHLMVQPGVGNSFLGDKSLTDQGLLARCLVVKPDSEQKRYVDEDPSKLHSIKSYRNTIKDLLNMALSVSEGTKNTLEPRVVELDPKGKQYYMQFHDDIQKNLGPDGALEPIKALASKAHDHAARLATTLAIFDNAYASKVSADCFTRAREIITHCLDESLRLVDVGGTDNKLIQAQKLLEWLYSQGKKSITLVELYQKGPTFVRDVKKARHFMELLRMHGYVRPDEMSKKEAYQIRPASQ